MVNNNDRKTIRSQRLADTLATSEAPVPSDPGRPTRRLLLLIAGVAMGLTLAAVTFFALR